MKATNNKTTTGKTKILSVRFCAVRPFALRVETGVRGLDGELKPMRIMKKTMLALALTLGVPAAVCLAQPAPDAAVPPAPQAAAAPAGGAAPDQLAPPRHEAGAPGQPRPEMGPGHAGARPEGALRHEERPFPPIALIAALDTNHDGIIDTNEIARAVEALRGLDKNKDGVLTADEFMGPRPHRGPGGAEGDDNVRPPRHARHSDLRSNDREPRREMGFNDRGPGRGMRDDRDGRYEDRGPRHEMRADARFEDRGRGDYARRDARMDDRPAHRDGARFDDRRSERPMPGAPARRFDDRAPRHDMRGGPEARLDDNRRGELDREPGRPGDPRMEMAAVSGARPPMMHGDALQVPEIPALPEPPQPPRAPAGVRE